ncbi:hypothetical protein Misp01_01200 [Microtetraspora sp. NBRC 13810]|nr:hypothetical protein Misp01_01200 [Microtetraspora sp. NBRC 13810]
MQDVTAGAAPGAAPDKESPEAIRRRNTRALRPARTPAGVAVALVLAVTLTVTAAETVSMAFGVRLGFVPFDRLTAAATGHAWSEPLVLGTAGALAALGTVLLLVALLPGRTRLVPVETKDPLIVIGFTRSGLRRSLRAVAESVNGVDRARVRMAGGQIEIRVVTEAERTGVVLRQVGAAVGDRLAALGALGGGEVVVRLRRKGA